MKFGVVGYGSIGSRHAANLVKLGYQPLVYDPARRRDVGFEREIYDACDAVIVASPTIFHEQALRACVERNRHVLIEKPIARAQGAVPKLLQLADDKGLVVMTGNNLRLHPCVQQTKIWLGDGKIGEPLWASFTCATLGGDPGGDGVLLNTGAHEVDIARYFFGPAEVIYADADNVNANFGLQHETGVRSMFHINLGTPHRIREFWIAGREGNIGVDLDARRMSVGLPGSAEAIAAPGSYDDDYVNELKAFIDRIHGVFAPGATGYDGLGTLHTLLEVEKKAGL